MRYESKVGCSEPTPPQSPAPPFSPSQIVGIPRLPKAQPESTVLNDLQGHFQVYLPSGFFLVYFAFISQSKF